MTKTYSLLIALTLGITLAFILPAGGKTAAVLTRIAELTLSLGRYLTFPLIVFSLPVAVNQLRRLLRGAHHESGRRRLGRGRWARPGRPGNIPQRGSCRTR